MSEPTTEAALREAIQTHRERRHWTTDQWLLAAGDVWPAAIARAQIEHDEAVDTLLRERSLDATLIETLEWLANMTADDLRGLSWNRVRQVARDALAAARPDAEQVTTYMAGFRDQYPNTCGALLFEGKRLCIAPRGHDDGRHE